jgi:hypothetical protein
MSRVRYFICCILVVYSTSASQEIDSLSNAFYDTSWTWEELSFNCSNHAVDYFIHQKYDSLELILDYWSKEFGFIEPVARMYLLYDIATNSLSENSFGMEIIDFLIDYKVYFESESYQRDRTDPSFMTERDYPFVSKRFDRFTVALADSLLGRVEEESSSFLLCEFYRNNFSGFSQKIRSEKYKDIALRSFYLTYIDEIFQEPEQRFGILAGLWKPLGKNRLLGNHPDIGGFYELKKGKWLLNGMLSIRFLDSKETYYVVQQGELMPTTDFFLLYGGIELGQILLRFHRLSFSLSAGFRVDVLEAVNSEIEDEQITHVYPNMNAGAALRFYTSRYCNNYFEIQYRVNYVNYRNKGGTDLSGNVANFRLMFGFEFNSTPKRVLKALGY